MGKQRTTTRTTRNPTVATGVNAYSRAASYSRAGKWAVKKKNGGKFPVHQAKPKAQQAAPAGRFYPADDEHKKLARRHTPKAAKLRASITPGTVLILLAGKFRGCRVVCLKQLTSGLLLVTGPFKLNGVPMRRVNQAYVIATSTKVDLSGMDVSKFDDAYFKKTETKSKSSEDKFFKKEEKTNTISDARKADQKTVDAAVMKAVSSVQLLSKYLSSKFSLANGQKPHDMKF